MEWKCEIKEWSVEMLNLEHIKRMFNRGYLTVETAMAIHKQGYSIICKDQILKAKGELD